MATIRAYTTIEQSRKLAEILPIESADMRYQAYYDNINNLKYIPRFVSTIIPLKADIPCWSLAALLGVLPEGTRLLKSINISSVGDIKYHCDCPKLNIDKWFDNPVDACYELVLKLHELKMF